MRRRQTSLELLIDALRISFVEIERCLPHLYSIFAFKLVIEFLLLSRVIP